MIVELINHNTTNNRKTKLMENTNNKRNTTKNKTKNLKLFILNNTTIITMKIHMGIISINMKNVVIMVTSMVLTSMIITLPTNTMITKIMTNMTTVHPI